MAIVVVPGVFQSPGTPEDKLSVRSIGTVYQNTTGSPLRVSISTRNIGSGERIQDLSLMVSKTTPPNTATGRYLTGYQNQRGALEGGNPDYQTEAVVPDQWYYMLFLGANDNGSTLVEWKEGRA